MAEVNKSSLDNILKAILSVAHQEQNLFYSPKIYSDQRNIVESLLLSALVKAYPKDQTVIDQIAPFVKVKTIAVSNGYVQLDDDYRNMIGSPMIYANPKGTGECGEQSEPLTIHNFNKGILKSGCQLNPVIILPQSEFAYRTQSTYDFPTYENPIGFFSDNKIKVCPYNITKVGVMYAKKERVVKYGYVMQPDDTYLYDAATTIETEFNSAAYNEIFNGMMVLYSAYAKNQEIQSWAALLNKQGIF